MILENVESLSLFGDVVTGDPDHAEPNADFSRADLGLSGWTLISNPLVVGVDKSQFTVTTNNETYSWADAIDFGFVSSNGWDAAGGTAFGFSSIWINRNKLPEEKIQWKPTWIGSDLNAVVFAYLKGYPLVINRDVFPFRFDCFDRNVDLGKLSLGLEEIQLQEKTLGPSKLDTYKHLSFVLNLAGLSPLGLSASVRARISEIESKPFKQASALMEASADNEREAQS